MKRSGRVWVRIFPDVPVTTKPAEVRMGKGKGNPEYWICRVHPGRVIFEVDGVSPVIAGGNDWAAAWALDASPEEVPMAASKAKGFATEAFTRIGVTGIQLHGAVGYTEGCDIQLYLKRSKWVRPMFGDEDFHYDRIAVLGEI